MGKIKNFFMGVKKEMGRVRWPNKKEAITYSIATISFVVLFACFFSFADIIIAGIRMVIK